MAKRLSKRRQAIQALCPPGVSYTLPDAIALLKKVPPVQFEETVELSVCLGVDPRKSDQVVRGAVDMPHGLGKVVRVVVFAQGPAAEAAKQAGADTVGCEDLVETIKAGWLEFDVVIASPDTMRWVGALGQILGPRGLMPNPKVGTVTPDVARAVQSAKSGQVHYKADKAGVVNAGVGKIGFAPDALQDNIMAFLTGLQRARPKAAKGVYFKQVTVSTTMGPGLDLDVASLALDRQHEQRVQ